MTWREYQRVAARFFTDLGMETDVEAKLQGARALHAVDVAVRFKAFGIDQLWLVSPHRPTTLEDLVELERDYASARRRSRRPRRGRIRAS